MTMNFLQFIQQKGYCRTAAGHTILNLRTTDKSTTYPIIGTIQWQNGYLTDMCWDCDGNPHNLPLNYGLQLIAMVPRIVFDKIDIKQAKDIDTLQQVIKEPAKDST